MSSLFLCVCLFVYLRDCVYFLVSDVEVTFEEHFHNFYVDQMHLVSVVRSCDLKYFNIFYGTDSLLYVVPDDCIDQVKFM